MGKEEGGGGGAGRGGGGGAGYITKSLQFYAFDVDLSKKNCRGHIPLNQKSIILSCLNYGYFPFV